MPEPSAAVFDWIGYVKSAGGAISPILFGALIWMNGERSRLLSQLEKREERLDELAERWLVVITELRTYLFQERKGS